MTDEDAITAGELALGLLDGEERAAALRLMIADPAFAREVERWRGRFAALNDEWRDIEPRSSVEAGINRATQPRLGVGPAWRWAAVAMSAVAAALLVALLLRPVPAPVLTAPPAKPAPALVAVFQPADSAAFSALVDLDRRVVRLSGRVATPAGRQAELWAIDADGIPHAAALLTGGTAARLRHDVVIAAGLTLAISIEPVGGSSQPTPTGPVVATGKLAAV